MFSRVRMWLSWPLLSSARATSRQADDHEDGGALMDITLGEGVAVLEMGVGECQTELRALIKGEIFTHRMKSKALIVI